MERLTPSQLAIHTQTHRPWSLDECVDALAAAGVAGISVWRHAFAETGVEAAARRIRGSGLRVPALVRGGFFCARERLAREALLDDNRRALDEAAALGAEMVVLVVGAVPGLPLADARAQVMDAIAALLPDAEARGVKLAIEPLHPMYAADKSCVNRMAEARAIWQGLDHPLVGVAVDAYHVWWDPDLDAEICLAGEADRLFALHICDWRVETRHLLTDRGLPGEGCIDLPRLRLLTEAAGFAGLVEVEVFSEEHWARDQGELLADLLARCARYA